MKRSISVLKNIRKSARQRIVNRNRKKRLKEALKKVKKLTTKRSAMKAYPGVQSMIDRSVQDGIIKKNAAAREKAQLLKHINTLK
ncbi:MAG: 30S ribosomal protein S20 [candidate division WOR-3 bacterium]|nr:MAG: 30S ribosomal protein S20 [candidate division WOR-3 bacterium]